MQARDLKVLVVEDEPVSRLALRSQVSASPEMRLVGDTASGAEAIELARTLSPDVVLMDVELEGDVNGIQAALAIKETAPETGIVILSGHDNRHFLSLAEGTGGWSYLLKKNVTDAGALARAVRGSLHGGMALDPELIAGLEPRPGSPLSGLSARHLEMVELLAQGHTDREIVEAMGVPAEDTVEALLREIYAALHITAGSDENPRAKVFFSYLDQTRNR